jgi:hypothetical protein
MWIEKNPAIIGEVRHNSPAYVAGETNTALARE